MTRINFRNIGKTFEGARRDRAAGRHLHHLQDYRAVQDALQTLLQLTFTRGNVDIGVERDFLDALPPGSVDPDVARRYDEYCRARGKTAGAHGDGSEPPKWDDQEGGRDSS